MPPTSITAERASGRFSPLVERLLPHLAALEVPIYLVGGSIRDALLGLTGHDLDYAVPTGAIDITFRLADALGASAYAMDEARDVGRIVLPNGEAMIDVARYRGDSLEADLNGRDFTINALALPGATTDLSQVIDRHQGISDLNEGRVRMIHAGSIESDPVRAMRAVRFAQQFGFTLTRETAAAARAAASLFGRISDERIREELTKLLLLDQPQQGLSQLHELGLLAKILPDVAGLADVDQSPPHFEAVLPHTLRVLGYASGIEAWVRKPGIGLMSLELALEPYRDALAAHLERRVDGGVNGGLLLRLGAVWHDAGKRQTKTVEPPGRVRFLGHDEVGAEIASRQLRRLTFSAEAVTHVQRIIRGHMRPLLMASAGTPPSRRAVYRFYRDLGSAGLDVGLLSLADHLATYDGPGDQAGWERLLTVVERLFAGYFLEHDKVVAPTRLLTGSELIAALTMEPGPEVGRLLKLIEEAQAAGDIVDREQALTLARKHHASP